MDDWHESRIALLESQLADTQTKLNLSEHLRKKAERRLQELLDNLRVDADAVNLS